MKQKALKIFLAGVNSVLPDKLIRTKLVINELDYYSIDGHRVSYNKTGLSILQDIYKSMEWAFHFNAGNGEEIGKINPNNIADITVIKDKSAVEMYGKEGEDGVIIINSKDASKESVIEKKPLIIIDGEKMPLGYELNTIKPFDIESISVLKDGGALEQYGEEGRNGVIVITKKHLLNNI